VTAPLRTVTLGGGQGFYGDATDRTGDLADACDYLILEGLAELTLAILQKDRARDPGLGYVRDLLAHARSFIPAVAEGRARVITNSGGLNPAGAAHAVRDLAASMGCDINVCTVLGDDVADLIRRQDRGPVPADLRFANAYIGARPIVQALETGAQVVITGRVADSALFLAPLVHEHGWRWDDWDKLAAGTAVGHLMECSGQATGGNLAWRWWDSPQPWLLPLPIADVAADGSAVLRKIDGSGGMVTFETVREQLMYEIHDPAAYLVPDVTADFTTIRLDDLGGDRVAISGATGRPAPPAYKALVCSGGGWMGEVSIGLGWPDAPEKARAMYTILQRRAQDAGLPVLEWHHEIWGHDALLPGCPTGAEPSEVVLRVAWRCAERAQAARVGRMLPPLYTSGPVPGMTTATHGFRFEPSELLRVEPVMLPRGEVDAQVRVVQSEAVGTP
jgi:hypothetical protein